MNREEEGKSGQLLFLGQGLALSSVALHSWYWPPSCQYPPGKSTFRSKNLSFVTKQDLKVLLNISGAVLVCVLCGGSLGTSFMFSSLEKLQFLLLLHYSHWFNPWVVLEGKGKGLRELFEASHLSRAAASRELDSDSGRSQSFVSGSQRFSVKQVCTASDRWASFSLDESCCQLFLSRQKIFRSELSVIQICTALDRWDLPCTRLIRWDKSPTLAFFCCR